MNLEGAVGIIFTALLWGITDPLLKKFGSGLNEKTADSSSSPGSGFLRNVSCEILFLLTNWKYVLTFASNQVKKKT